MIAAANFVGLPLMFLSSILLATALMPGWITASPASTRSTGA